jgi:hypothetical protein
MCGATHEFDVPCDEGDPGKKLRDIIEEQGWFCQLNYPNFDIYCSKKCAA